MKPVIFIIICLSIWYIHDVYASSVADFLSLGDESLANDEIDKAINLYTAGIKLVETTKIKHHDSLATIVSIYTNLATAYSSIGENDNAAKYYEIALLRYEEHVTAIADSNIKEEVDLITAQTAFYLGMVYQDMNRVSDSIDAYSFSNSLDSMHWASLANLGAVLHDNLKNFKGALNAYNKAYNILTDIENTPTDPPPEPRFILSQLQYRIGLCISNDSSQKCTLADDPEKSVSCKEMAAHAFSLAIDYDPENSQLAKHMLATITADATMKRASNDYVKSLFDDYAHNFERSLVQDLGYTGYERLRQGFDRAFGGTENVPIFDLVVDAGCGTGLVGEQFRNISLRLLGVDLSEAIIKEAVLSRPNLYDEVVAADVTDVFRSRKPVSLIIAGDSYIYFGDLDPLFASMFEGLDDNGYAAFTLENVSKDIEKTLDETKSDWRWQLTASGRFAHRQEYVINVAKENGLKLFFYESLIDFRYEHGVGVQGHIFIMQKVRSRSEEL